MADKLSQEEIDANLVKRAEAESGGRKRTSGQRIVTSYDFKHPARVNKDQLRTLENLHDNFARLLSSTFSGAMRAAVDVDTAFVDQATYAEFIMSLSNPSSSYEFTLGPTNGQVIIDVAMPITFAFVDRMFGGKGSSQGVDARQMSQIEMGVTARIIKRVVEDLEATWQPILPVEIYDIMLETNPEFMQIAAPSEIVILLAFEVKSTNASGLISLCYPFFTLESILPRLGQQTYVRRARLNQEETVRQNRLRLGKTAVPVRAELGRNLTLDEAGSLRPGDVVQLEARPGEPVVLFSGAHPKHLALPFAGRHGNTTLKIAGNIPAEIEEVYATFPSDASARQAEGADAAPRVRDPAQAAGILAHLPERLQQDVAYRMATMDLGKFSDREMQVVLREVDQKDLVVALKAATPEVAEKVLYNMSDRVRQFIVEELEFLGPMRLSEVEEVQLRIVQIVRELEQQGQITIVRGDADDSFV